MTIATKIEVLQKVLDSVCGSSAKDWHQHVNGAGWVQNILPIFSGNFLRFISNEAAKETKCNLR